MYIDPNHTQSTRKEKAFGCNKEKRIQNKRSAPSLHKHPFSDTFVAKSTDIRAKQHTSRTRMSSLRIILLTPSPK
ncbi:MAG: hypothetical protein CL920_04120 [Deltaproteobacteria bacterium]|nr:hypothetical protein [Deltaproteobacteria bacterium]MBU47862.1 hypothetical protein [Deltaproteobacteria bacterium]